MADKLAQMRGVGGNPVLDVTAARRPREGGVQRRESPFGKMLCELVLVQEVGGRVATTKVEVDRTAGRVRADEAGKRADAGACADEDERRAALSRGGSQGSRE